MTYGVKDGRIVVIGEDLRPRPNLDASLAALAQEYGPRLLAILLSGWGSDGVNGMKVVRQGGGTAIIQDPATAEVGQLPKTALAHGVAHKVLGPSAIVKEVEQILKGAYSASAASTSGGAKARPRGGPKSGAGAGAGAGSRTSRTNVSGKDEQR